MYPANQLAINLQLYYIIDKFLFGKIVKKNSYHIYHIRFKYYAQIKSKTNFMFDTDIYNNRLKFANDINGSYGNQTDNKFNYHSRIYKK